MKKYLSHIAAAYHWNIYMLDQVLDKGSVDRYRNDNVIDITYTDQNLKYQKKKHVVHVCERPLPPSAVVKCGKDFVASPELVFLELANDLDIHRLILLGLQMCSHPVGNAAKAVTTKRKLTVFIKKMKGYNGQPKAERALKYIEDGSASIMESLTFMTLTLPNSYGGYGLKGARFNHEIVLNKEGKRQLKQNRCFVDLFYKESKLAVEYDSKEEHDNDEANEKDNIRATVLENQGFEVISLVTKQLYDEVACRAFAQKLSSHLGKSLRIRAKGFRTANRKLRSLLP